MRRHATQPILAMDMRIVYTVYRYKEAWPSVSVVLHGLASRYRTQDISVVLWFIFVFMTPELGFRYVWNVVGNFLAVVALQYVLQAKRPIDYDSRLYLPECTDPDTMGFPSLDSHMAVVIVGPTYFVSSVSPVTCAIFTACVVLIGWTRVWIGMRFPSQVVASWATGIVGVIIGNLCHYTLVAYELPAYYNRVCLLLLVASAAFCLATWVERAECRVVGVPRAEFTRVLSRILHGDGSNGAPETDPSPPTTSTKRDSFYFLMKSMHARRTPSTYKAMHTSE
ncbi:hypothetical protein SPRG_05361 [Saprolegnia parasitica CBS 223.65]|uniref:Phosphatidic acid phosphatase type 2/haloperoxidase domain-containing protein n=1 Tax=Saprolegnia parasitica (strain CBS 223.65) TaxID=695850 RepID=A0A067CHI3_SAPPC|nr:hypothetical protein SPRG_05361 [Saprolegnia parasitica CBS 223.65]KDO30169.1 hypothetical protein SPRG_05361 [Saprolegnia parasitica CBS 223.65]|eukprot:XP_012199347.1 hypothetical protein SPRG_05361 [Saprolegnia parasitica CBS 223.65]